VPRRHRYGERVTAAARFLVVLDADSTLLQDEVIELIADEAGRGAEVAAATEAAMRGEVDFAASLRSRVDALRGVPLAALGGVGRRVRPTLGAADLIAHVHRRGGRVGVVSGGFHEILDPIAQDLGVDVWRANRLGVADGVLTGRVAGAILDAAGKAQWLARWAREMGVAPRRTYAIGDGANDLRMLADAALGVAFNAKPVVRAAADVVVDRLDLREVIPLLP